MKYASRIAYQRKSFADLLATYQKDADKNPADPAAVYLAGYALQDVNTPESLRLVERAQSLDPSLPWTYITLASLYGRGKFADPKKAAANVAGYYRACPDSLESLPLMMLNTRGDITLQTSIASRVRERLSKETDPRLLKTYSALWGLEFRTHPVKEHPDLRRQVAEDVKRLETLNPKPDAESFDVIIAGLRQCGAPPERIRAVEDRLIKECPDSDNASYLARERWRKNHPEPKPDDPPEKWDSYQQASMEATQQWIQQFPRAGYLRPTLLQSRMGLPSTPAATVKKTAEETLRASEESYGPSSSVRLNVAGLYLRRNIETKRALDLIKSAEPLMKEASKRFPGTDRSTPRELEMFQKFNAYQSQNFQELMLKACRKLKRVEDARRLKPAIGGPVPKDAALVTGYWANRARLAEIEGRAADALTYYQNALDARPAPPGKVNGRVEDPLLDEARALWKSLGGSEETWAAWRKPRSGVKEAQAASAWEKPSRDIPSFELSDLAGKLWTLNSLRGKTLLVNVWATWCGPCQAELPHLQKLHEKVKGRSDIAVVSLNMDDEVGLVEPFVKEKGFAFPVLLAYKFLRDLEVYSIPRNWIVDAQGKWRWEQVGFDSSDTSWEDAMLAKLGSTK